MSPGSCIVYQKVVEPFNGILLLSQRYMECFDGSFSTLSATPADPLENGFLLIGKGRHEFTMNSSFFECH